MDKSQKFCTLFYNHFSVLEERIMEEGKMKKETPAGIEVVDRDSSLEILARIANVEARSLNGDGASVKFNHETSEVETKGLDDVDKRHVAEELGKKLGW